MPTPKKPLKSHQPHPYRKLTGDAVKRLKMETLGQQAYLLRIQGFTYHQIGEKLGHPTLKDSKIYDYIKRAMLSEAHVSADRAHMRLEQDARYRALLQVWWPRAMSKKAPNKHALDGVMAILKRLDDIWGLELGKQLERDGISDAMLAVLHELQARPLGPSGHPEPKQPSLPDPSTLDAIWDDMESAGEVEPAASPEPPPDEPEEMDDDV
jgi:hypothetical protein